MINRLCGNSDLISGGASTFDPDELQRAYRHESDPVCREMLFRQLVEVLNAGSAGKGRHDRQASRTVRTAA